MPCFRASFVLGMLLKASPISCCPLYLQGKPRGTYKASHEYVPPNRMQAAALVGGGGGGGGSFICSSCWPLAAQGIPLERLRSLSVFCASHARLTSALLMHPAPCSSRPLPPMAACLTHALPPSARAACYSLSVLAWAAGSWAYRSGVSSECTESNSITASMGGGGGGGGLRSLAWSPMSLRQSATEISMPSSQIAMGA